METIEKVVVGRNPRDPLQIYRADSVQCSQCFITFSDPGAKERHLRRSHREQYTQHLQQTNTLFICYKCDKCFFSPEELSQHRVSHSADEQPFLCTHCQKPFSVFSEFNKHRRRECALRGRFCKDCGASFPGPYGLRVHRKATHAGLRDGAAGGGGGFQRCERNRCFPTEEKLSQHQQTLAHVIKCDEKQSDKPVNDDESKKMKQEEGPAKWERSQDSSADGSAGAELQIPCPAADCDCTFPSVEALRTHKRSEHGPPPHKGLCCKGKCGKTFGKRRARKTHQAFLKHDGR